MTVCAEKKNCPHRIIYRRRIFVENAIGGMKRFNILNFVFRNKKENFGDDVIALCAGLWNMMIID
ncbi:transposase family protein [Desulfonema ishimotonii]|uniref:transposase family protein n=1 Tax=Desulfonema ishimotonii TaxID=45657 RepID=UPI00350E4224